MNFDITERVKEARRYFDNLLEERIERIAEMSGVPRDRFIKINPMDFIERNRMQTIKGYYFRNIKDFIEKNKKDDTFLISPLDKIQETAAQCGYKSGENITRKIRASKCEIVPVSKEAAEDFLIRNHRQNKPLISTQAICFGLLYKNEIVSIMIYDITNGAIRGGNKNYELLRLSIAKNTVVHGGASKLQGACEDVLKGLGIKKIYSYSNATINNGKVYSTLGFACKRIEGGQPFVVLKNNSIIRLINLNPLSTDAHLARYGWIKTHVGGNKYWEKEL